MIVCWWTTFRKPKLVVVIVLSISLITSSGCSSGAQTSSSGTTLKETTIRITGAGTAYPSLQMLASAFESKNAGINIVFLPDNQTSGAIMATREGIATIGLVTRPPNAEESGGKLRYREFARDALLLATHQSVTGVSDLRITDIRSIYSGKIQNWKELGGPDAPIVLLDRPEDESAKVLLRQRILGKDLLISPQAVDLKKESELVTSLRDTHYSIGAFSFASYVSNGLTVNKIAVEGIAPSVDNVKTGRYQMVRTLGIVWTDDMVPGGQSFRDFIISEEGSRLLSEQGYAPSIAGN